MASEEAVEDTTAAVRAGAAAAAARAWAAEAVEGEALVLVAVGAEGGADEQHTLRQ